MCKGFFCMRFKVIEDGDDWGWGQKLSKQARQCSSELTVNYD